MRVLDLDAARARPIERFQSVAASSVHVADGHGEAHVYCLHLAPGACIGAHVAGPAQLFLVATGTAWAAGEDGQRVALRAGQGAYFAPGELHSKGSQEGATAIMVQVGELELR